MVKIGAKNKQVEIQQPAEVIDTFGDPQPSWTTVVTVWAEIQPLTGREFLGSSRVQTEVNFRIMIRWQPELSAIDATWRVKYGSRIFGIVHPNNMNEADVQFELMCKERN